MYSKLQVIIRLRLKHIIVRSRYYSAITYGSGPHGVDGRIPFFPLETTQEDSSQNDNKQTKNNENISDNHDKKTTNSDQNTNTGITITDPFILYQNYINQGLLEKDELQLRVMKEFQKLYHRVVDYSPPDELAIKISLLLRQIEIKHAEAVARESGKKYSPLKFNAITNMFRKDPDAEKRQLVKFITDEEELANFASPQGLLIHGEVGCGKSMLMDIFAASLPHKSKMRWHYNNFILWVYTEMHKIQKERMLTATISNGKNNQKMTMENEFILFEVAQKMINKNTVLMLDEFMLPDIASANIIKILFTYYFKLGGVLIATSNKLPEELYSNEFHKTSFKGFVAVLNARCQTIDMRSDKDYRSVFASISSKDPHLVVKQNNGDHDTIWNKLIKAKALRISENSTLHDTNIKINQLDSKPSSFTVYNRTTHIPITFKNDICYLDFGHICQGLFSSSDYITLASKFKVIILDNVPVLTTKMKNEARRFITLLDAIYEAKCQFFMRSDVPIDSLFFPDANNPSYSSSDLNDGIDSNRLEVQDEEMFAKTAIAMSNPYRPNVSSYDQKHTESYDDYKKVFKNPFSKKNNEIIEEDQKDIDFKNIKAFTGEDEKFAYKRAVLRIREMVSSEIWRNNDRWVPIDESMRPWESSSRSENFGVLEGIKSINLEFETEKANEKIDELIKQNKSIKQTSNTLFTRSLPRIVSKNNDIPFRQFNSRIAPIFTNLQHFWAMGDWKRDQGNKLKDQIVKTWIRTGSKNK